ncbi:putative Ig domain-containing protein [Motiliproteus sp. MSK22-1]|uniref:putative Ig domain-containing protein n=1 Tax=Motiliproteus sp. MSK22-1 TaxID=1897630 RepID=UPI0009765570|nr:putative Ig domain-containing protein [Motiliproteus sp. MSK22-1]OMH35344.1 hypothetical protein BGP75_10750 [Motiliproteus sp. MSK22-1]
MDFSGVRFSLALTLSFLILTVSVGAQGQTVVGPAASIFDRVKEAVTKGGNYTGNGAVAWHNRHRCLGCHTQTQSLLGLSAAMDKATVDVDNARFLYNAIAGSQKVNGATYLALPELSKNQTSLSFWAFNQWPNRVQSFPARVDMASYFLSVISKNGNHAYWTKDDWTGWITSSDAITAIVSQGIGGLLADDLIIAEGDIKNWQPTSQVVLSNPREYSKLVAFDGYIYTLTADKLLRINAESLDVETIAELQGDLVSSTQLKPFAIDATGVTWVVDRQRRQLIRIGVSGDLTTTPVPGWELGSVGDLAINQDGRIIATTPSKVFEITPDGQIITILSADSEFSDAYSIVPAEDDHFIISSPQTNQLYKIDLSGNYSIYVDGLPFAPYQLGKGPAGEYFIDYGDVRGQFGFDWVSEGRVIQRVFKANDARLDRADFAYANDRLFVLNRWGEIQVYEHRLYNRDVLQSLRTEVPNIARWILSRAGTNSENVIQAFHLSALAELKPFILDEALKAQVSQVIEEVSERLLERQRIDGGWGKYTYSGTSDPLVTAWVGIALDYTNPDINEPFVQNAINYLLSTQSEDGSWSGAYFDTRHGATGMVMAYLPVALERIGGWAVAQGNPNPAVAGQTITLDGSASVHPEEDRSIISYQWDIDNDGVFDLTGPIVQTSFPAVGEYPVTLRVVDDSPTPQTAEARLIVNINLPPLKPTADAGGPYLFCDARKPWVLDGSASSNPDDGLHEEGRPADQLVSWQWDLNGDLNFTDVQGEQADGSSILSSMGVGDYIARLRVTDNTASAYPSSGQPNLTDTAETSLLIRDAADAMCSCQAGFSARAKYTKVGLDWENTGTHHYNIYRADSEQGPFVKIAESDNPYAHYLDLGLELDKTYYYGISEANEHNKETCHSKTISVTPTARRINTRNRPPVITSTAVEIAVENTEYNYQVVAQDPDRRDVVEYILQTAPTGMSIDGGTGVISWVPINAQVGQQQVVVRAADTQGLYDEQSFIVQVSNNNQPPQIVSTPAATGRELMTYRYQARAIDPDLGDIVEFHLISGPSGVAIDSSGLLLWTPQTGQQGSHSVTINATDTAGLTDQQQWQVTIVEQNHNPVITSVPETTVVAGQIWTYDVEATDANVSDTLTYMMSHMSGPSIDPTSGLITWPTSVDNMGEHDITVSVHDDQGGSAAQSFILNVVAENHPPQITSIANQSAPGEVLYEYDVEAADPNPSDNLVYSLLSTGEGSEIDSQTGLVSWLPSAEYNSGSQAYNSQCRKPGPQPGVLDPVLKWHWSGSSIKPTFNQVMSSPVVAQLNDDNGDGEINTDDIPDVIFTSFENGRYSYEGVLRAVSGADGRDIWTVAPPSTAYTTPAVGDIDDDGVVEIIVGGPSNKDLYVYENTGELKWKIAVSYSGHPALADLNNDGTVEIIYGPAVYDVDGNRLWGYPGSVNNHWIDSHEAATVVDLDLDGDLEIFSGGKAYSHDGAVLWSHESTLSLAGVANLDEDEYPEIVAIDFVSTTVSSYLYILAHDGNVQSKFPITAGGGGAITVADVDGDGLAEIGVAGAQSYTVFETDGSVKWQTAVQDLSSGATGSSVFDFDADGRAEILYADETTFRIYDGETGNTRLEIPNPSGTLFEYPLVVDIDNDHQAEIILVSNNYAFSGTTGIRVFESASGSWAPTRSIWNQHTYHINNVNDDGTIPQYEQPSWLSHNSYRLNTFADRHPYGQPDLAVYDLTLEEQGDSVDLLARVYNRGMAPAESPVSVEFYNGDPDNGGVLLGVLEVSSLESDQSSLLRLSGIPASNLTDTLYARIDGANTIEECIEDNNQTQSALFKVKVADPEGLNDTQLFALSVGYVNHAPTLTAISEGEAKTSQSFVYQVDGADNDLGDSLSYQLLSAPEGMTVNSVNGTVRWQPTSEQAGVHQVEIQITDLSGLTAVQILTLRVENDEPPVITSPADETGTENQNYSYLVEATDPNPGDALTYSLNESPTGMSIDPVTGSIQWQPTDSYVQSNALNNLQCSKPSEALGAFEVVTKWHWNSAGLHSGYNHVLSTPVVVQTDDDNGDGVIGQNDSPDVAFIGHSIPGGRPGVLWLIDGDSGQEKWVNTELQAPWATSISAGDIDGDGLVEFVGLRSDSKLMAISNTGDTEWISSSTSGNTITGSPSIYDLDGDGSLEILSGNSVFDGAGNLLWTAQTSNIGKNHRFSNVMTIVQAADINLDGELEVLIGASAHSASGGFLWSNLEVGDGLVAIGNFNTDDFAEVVVVSGNRVFLLDHLGRKVWGPVNLNGSGNGGSPTIADMDGDGQPEIGVASGEYYTVLDTDGSTLWISPIQDLSSSITGSSVFDFNNDGRVEVIYADELFLRVYDGQSGSILLELPNTSTTGMENPVIVDIDNDNHAEIVFVANNFTSKPDGQVGIRVIEGINDNWVATRSIWNQHAYNINNINDDGTVPAQPEKSWLTHNTYRLNTFPDRSPLDLPDLRVGEIKYDEENQNLSATITNRGLAPTLSNVVVQFYLGDPEDNGSLIETVDLGKLEKAQQLEAVLPGITADSLTEDIYVVVDQANQVDECLTDNNTAVAALVKVKVKDTSNLFDTQTYLLSVKDINDPVAIINTPANAVMAGTAFEYQVALNDPDLGDDHLFELSGAPQGMSINTSGLIRWATGTEDTGSYPVTVTVTDLTGSTDQMLLTVNITANANVPPVLSGSPLASATVDQLYSYAIQASDPDGDTLTYALLAQPNGMTINTGGVINWTPTATQLGTHSVTLRISDGLAYVDISYSITVSGAANTAPVINGTPLATAVAGNAYSYPIDASDAEGDDLSYTLLPHPSGMSISAAGVISWTPTLAQVGPNTVIFRVSDGQLHSDFNYTLTVNASTGTNTPPTLNGSPIASAVVGQLYSSVVDATDAEGDTLSYMLLTYPEGMIISEGGVISWTPTLAQLGSHTVFFRVSDGQADINAGYTLTVRTSSVNTAPIINGSVLASSKVNQLYSYAINATDAEGDSLSYSLQTKPDGMTVSADGVIDWAPTLAQLGPNAVVFRVSDGQLYSELSYSIEVTELVSVTITNTPKGDAFVGQTYSNYLWIDDPAFVGVKSIALLEAPSGMSIEDGANGKFLIWSPNESDVGKHSVIVQVEDNTGAVTQLSYSLHAFRGLKLNRRLCDENCPER